MDWLVWLEKKQGGTGGTRKYWLYTDGKTSKESGWHNQIHSDDNDEMERGSAKITHDTGYGGKGYFGVTLRNHLSDSQRSHINQQIKENRYHREPDNVTFDHGHNNNDTVGSSKKHYPKYSHLYIPKDDDYKNAAWELWLEKKDKYSGMTPKQRKIQESIDSENDSDNQYYTKASWEAWLEKNNAIETSHKDEKEKEEWDGKFSSSTIEDEVKDDKDDKAVSEEEPLDELTEGKLEEIEKLKSTFKEPTKKNPYDKPYTNFKKLSQRQIVQDFLDNPDMNTFQTEHVPKEAKKSWEAWLEKDALDGKGGNEAKDDLMMPSLMGMYKKPTKQTKEGQARDYIRDTPHVESYHSRRLGHGKKYESGRRPLEKKPQSGGFVNEPRKEEWDITADQDAQQRGSGKNTFDDKDDVEPAGGFIQGQGRTIPKTGKSPKIKPQGKGVKHKGRPRGSKNKTWESWLNKYEETVEDKRLAVKLDEARAIASGKVSKPKIKPDAGVDAEMGEFSNIQAEKLRSATVSPLDSWATWLEKMQGAGDARFGNQHLTGLDQKPVDNEEDEANILPAKDENQEENDEKQEETEDKEGKDNKPYKALSQE